MPKPTHVKALPGFRIWLQYDDGLSGEVDLSDIAGRGVFGVWNDRALFERVRVGPGGAIEWKGDLDLCPDAMYLRLTGQSPEDLFPGLKPAQSEALHRLAPLP